MKCVEEILRELEGRAAVLRYMAHSGMTNPELLDVTVLSGIGDVCGEIEGMARIARQALPAAALAIEVKKCWV